MSEATFSRVEAYLTGELSNVDRQQFELDMAADPSLQQEVEETRNALLAVERAAVADRIAQARRRSQIQRSGGARIRRLSSKRILAIAASLTLLVAAGLWTFSEQRAGSPAGLSASYFEPALGLPTTLGLTDDQDFQEGMIDYKLGDYDAAIKQWSTLQQPGLASDTLSYFLGLAHLANDDASAALDQLSNISDGSYRADAYWYRALSLLRLDRVAEAKQELEELLKLSSSHRTQALELLEQL